MAVTVDPRPTYFGDRMIVTGTYDAGEALIDLRSLLASIDIAIVNCNGSQPQDVGDAANTGVTRINVFDSATLVDRGDARFVIESNQEGGASLGGSFFVIGRRS